ncbi:hypothetical protein KIN34_01635 [Cellulomonas sp. DKR-3]|uniref:Secreted protein n=1 Tax=Cellulomonas fulva TaxID=2835530 RepID=A0ABS5TV67_9CELL|nr:hypothetical protein [Cellulomonas fulva]MBT0992992.1 hypothetical protein [Cellulomonas fulva]
MPSTVRTRRPRAAWGALVALTLSLGAVALPATTAAAATSKPVTYQYIHEGLRGEFSVRWASKRLVEVSGWIADVCPQDGRGVYLDGMGTREKNGDERWWYVGLKDTNGCGNGRVTLKSHTGQRWTGWRSSTPLPNLLIRVCAIDRDGHKAGWCVTKIWDNPKVG